MKSNNQKGKAFNLAINQIDKQFGKGSIMRLGEKKPLDDGNSISTGALSLDIALGVGGVPKGRIIYI